MTYREPGPEPEKPPDPHLAARVLEAVDATFASHDFSRLHHYQDHVQSRWHINLRRALDGCDEFIWAEKSWGELHHLMNDPWLRFFWRTRKMTWAERFGWISERLKRRERRKALKAG